MTEERGDPILAAQTDDEMDAAIRGRSLEDVVRVANTAVTGGTAPLLIAALERRLARRKERREGRATAAEEAADES